MQLARPSQSTTAISVVWALAPLFTCGIATPFTIGYAAYRKRAPMIAVAALLYFLSLFVLCVITFTYGDSATFPDWAGLLVVLGLFTNWIGGLIHSLAIRSAIFAPRAQRHASYPPPPPHAYRPTSYPPAPYPPHQPPPPYANQHHPRTAPNQQRPGTASDQQRPGTAPNHQNPGTAPNQYPGTAPNQRPSGVPNQQRPGATPQHQHSAPQPPVQPRPQRPPQEQYDRRPSQEQKRYQEDRRPVADPVTTNPPVSSQATSPGSASGSTPGGVHGASTLPTQAPGPLPAGESDHIGPYRLIGSLGQGGQGAVYLGETPDGTRVAIKVLHARLASETGAQQRFLREVEAARRVAPFSTARVIDADVADERLFIVSEYVEGSSLEQLVRERGPRGHDGLVRLALGTSGALAAIHRAGIVHRDFKPSNVLIGSDGPRVVDFGIARVLDNATATSSGVLGTPAYMSPEQVSGERVGPESDVFSWAATMIFAATGRPAFGEDNIAAVFNRIFTKQPDLSALPDSLAQVVGKCLEKRPENRPTASDVMLAIVH
ncbi:serine/threonine-protein kinase [Sphaerisporangium sp. NPDC088356]|uniref:serine/threonine-protein kinase n=1 Tax=Sphaerisporangium sp. NPDC088356 TaxID=3154871 RepID=UPI00341D84F1